MKTLAFKLLTIVITLVVFLSIIELGLRTFAPIYTAGDVNYYKYDEKLGFRNKESVHFYKTTDFQAEYLTNQYGTINFQDTFDDYDILVFALGDSYTEGAGVPRDASYPFQLDLMLNFDKGEYQTDYAVLNGGLCGYGGKQYLLVLDDLTEKFGKPQFILYFGNVTDYGDDLFFDNGHKHRHFVDGNPHLGIMVKPIKLIATTQIGLRIKLFLGSLRQNMQMQGITGKNNTDETTNPTPQKPVAELQEPILNELLEISNKLDATLIVSWSSISNTNQDSYLWLQDWANRNDVKFADWYPKAASVLDKIPKLPTNNEHSVDHYRTWVNMIIAKSFAEQILNESSD